jgi:hypothetical protein
MKPVIQLEPTGCGIASVAAIAGVSYSRAKSVANSFGIFADDRNLWSQTAYVRKLLRHFGLRTNSTEIPFHSWEALPDLALLSIKWHLENGRPFWHWVVFVRENGRPYVLDSKKGLRQQTRTDFGRIKPKWFIRVAEENFPTERPAARTHSAEGKGETFISRLSVSDCRNVKAEPEL